MLVPLQRRPRGRMLLAGVLMAVAPASACSLLFDDSPTSEVGVALEDTAHSSLLGTELLWQHTVAGRDRLLLVAIGHVPRSSETNTITRVRYGDQDLEFLVEASTGISAAVQLWTILDPTPGTHSIHVEANYDGPLAAGSLSMVSKGDGIASYQVEVGLDGNAEVALPGQSGQLSIAIAIFADGLPELDEVATSRAVEFRASTTGGYNDGLSLLVMSQPALDESPLVMALEAGAPWALIGLVVDVQ